MSAKIHVLKGPTPAPGTARAKQLGCTCEVGPRRPQGGRRWYWDSNCSVHRSTNPPFDETTRRLSKVRDKDRYREGFGTGLLIGFCLYLQILATIVLLRWIQ